MNYESKMIFEYYVVYNNYLSYIKVRKFMDSKNMKLIASGSGSQIYHYSNKGGDYALKFVPASCAKQTLHLANEAKILSVLDHDYIIKCVKYQQKLSLHGKKQNSQLRDVGNILVLEYATKGSLLNFINSNKLNLSEVKTLFKKICQGLKHIHFKGYSHRDLKLDNILIFEENLKFHPKISDFGFASNCYQEGEVVKFRHFRGTKKGYMAPQIHEVLTNKQHQYDAQKTDIFSLGVIMFALVLGRLPFEYSTHQNNIYKLLIAQKYQQFWKQHQSRIQKLGLGHNEQQLQKFKDIFVRMVHYDPEQRPNISQVLQNSWFSI